MENISDLCAKFTNLKSKSKVQDKIKTLDKYAEDDDFCYLLEYLLNEDKISGIRKGKLNKKIKTPNELIVHYNSLKLLIDYLLENNTGTDKEIYIVQTFLDKISDETERQIIADIITKNFKCGVTDLTAYGHIPGIKRNWKERKGHSLIDRRTGEIDLNGILGKSVIISLKLDGYRYKMHKENGDIKFYSASGKIVDGLNELIEFAKNLPDGLYDGECIAKGEFKDSTERFNATTKILRRDGEKKGVEFIVFDYISVEDTPKFFNFEKIEKSKSDRLKELLAIPNLTNETIIKVVPIYLTEKITKESTKTIMDIYNKVIEKGEEGLIVDVADSPYERKKGNTMFKLKPELSGDFKIVDTVEGEGKYKNKLGAFIIEYKNNTVNVGSGLTDEIREEVWKNPDSYKNKLIEVVYFGETQDENGEYSLRLPRFKRFRFDKNDISYD